MKILTAKQMKEIDRLTSEICGVPSLTLMENAGFNLYLALEEMLDDVMTSDIAIICGKGNNGGDGFVLARQLLQRGVFPDIFLLADKDSVQGDAAVNLQALLKSDYPVVEITDEESWADVADALPPYDVVVDAILGTGICKPLEGLFAQVVADINESEIPVLSVDIPSGMYSDAMEAEGLTVWADRTITFTAPKIAHILHPAQEAIGDLEIVPIGTPPALLEKSDYYVNLLTREETAEYLLPRPISSHKGTYGHVALIAGSRGKTGAAGLSSNAALRSGSGLVTALVPETVQDVLAAYQTELMTEGLPANGTGSFSRKAAAPVLKLLKGKSAAGIGPGLTTATETIEFVHAVVQQSSVPLVIDADGINAFQGCLEALSNDKEQPLVLTPHPGEFSRLTGVSSQEILRNQIEVSREFCKKHSVWLVLKTFRPLVVSPEGTVFVSPMGNPGMASAGMGDVLTGVLTSLIGQYAAINKSDPGDITRAVCLGVFLHGLAGDLAAEETGWEALIAGDVLESLADAYQLLEEV